MISSYNVSTVYTNMIYGGTKMSSINSLHYTSPNNYHFRDILETSRNSLFSRSPKWLLCTPEQNEGFQFCSKIFHVATSSRYWMFYLVFGFPKYDENWPEKF